MTLQQEANSWLSPKALVTSPAPEVGSKAPTSSKLQLPRSNGKPCVISFLRHCGCPFTEKTFDQLRKAAAENHDVNFIAISHSSEEATEKWVFAVGGEWDVTVISLSISNLWHVLNPWSLYSAFRLAWQEKITNRPTESGNRWQTSGSFAMDGEGVVRWSKVANAADEIPDFGEALKALGNEA
ncbi:hypothetical protein NA56DRAFT_669198 [Hyaloscypha hepaticicola]|uniref:Thioredoxin domain-containing protein n=1 Tax=Hyaloscypha hepaticicola TaxID=2082293 RepID=A0A2J6QCL3_9HELO|nr:hypothetical protein NA56DRAFT_669198 [Hyaloscypha hepaticicola]